MLGWDSDRVTEVPAYDSELMDRSLKRYVVNLMTHPEDKFHYADPGQLRLALHPVTDEFVLIFHGAKSPTTASAPSQRKNSRTSKRGRFMARRTDMICEIVDLVGVLADMGVRITIVGLDSLAHWGPDHLMEEEDNERFRAMLSETPWFEDNEDPELGEQLLNDIKFYSLSEYRATLPTAEQAALETWVTGKLCSAELEAMEKAKAVVSTVAS